MLNNAISDYSKFIYNKINQNSEKNQKSIWNFMQVIKHSLIEIYKTVSKNININNTMYIT